MPAEQQLFLLSLQVFVDLKHQLANSFIGSLASFLFSRTNVKTFVYGREKVEGRNLSVNTDDLA